MAQWCDVPTTHHSGRIPKGGRSAKTKPVTLEGAQTGALPGTLPGALPGSPACASAGALPLVQLLRLFYFAAFLNIASYARFLTLYMEALLLSRAAECGSPPKKQERLSDYRGLSASAEALGCNGGAAASLSRRQLPPLTHPCASAAVSVTASR